MEKHKFKYKGWDFIAKWCHEKRCSFTVTLFIGSVKYKQIEIELKPGQSPFLKPICQDLIRSANGGKSTSTHKHDSKIMKMEKAYDQYFDQFLD